MYQMPNLPLAPLGIGNVTLADGRAVKGFLCETYATIGAEDITAFGGWRAWLDRPAGISRLETGKTIRNEG